MATRVQGVGNQEVGQLTDRSLDREEQKTISGKARMPAAMGRPTRIKVANGTGLPARIRRAKSTTVAKIIETSINIVFMETQNAAPKRNPTRKLRRKVMRPATAEKSGANHTSAHRSSGRNSVETKKNLGQP